MAFLLAAAAGAAAQTPAPTLRSEFYPFESLPVRGSGRSRGRSVLRGKNRKGMTLNVVDIAIDSAASKQVVMYLSQQDNIARQAEIVVKGHGDKETLIVDTKSLSVGNAPDAKNFAFNAPDGSRELTAEELNSAKWFTDLEEAKKVAARTKRLLMVDFYADW